MGYQTSSTPTNSFVTTASPTAASAPASQLQDQMNDLLMNHGNAIVAVAAGLLLLFLLRRKR